MKEKYIALGVIACITAGTLVGCGSSNNNQEVVDQAIADYNQQQLDQMQQITEADNVVIDTEDGTVEVSNNTGTTLEDGNYITSFLKESDDGINVKRIEFFPEYIVVEAGFNICDGTTSDYIGTVDSGVFTIAIDENTKFAATGGMGGPQYMSEGEYEEFIQDLLDSGLGFHVVIENGVATQIAICS